MRDLTNFRPLRLVTAVIVGATALWMARAVDAARTQGFPEWAQAAWTVALIVGVLGSVLLAVNAVGILTAENLGFEPNGSSSLPGRSLKIWHFVATYVGSLLIVVGFAYIVEANYERSGEIGLYAGYGVLFLTAASGRPWWLYATLRRLGWFAAITNDKWMKVTLAVIGALLLFVSANNWVTR